MAPRNFVILFSSREGSTAIINSLSGQPGIRVPFTEDLDKHKFCLVHPAKEIAEKMEQVFETGTYPDARSNQSGIQNDMSNLPYKVIGFKWRIFGNLKKIAKVLKKNNVLVFVLTRQDFLELSASTYVHKLGNKIQSEVDMPKFPQFRALNHSPEDKQAFLEEMRRPRFKLFPRRFKRIAFNRFRKKTRQAIKAWYLFRSGLDIRQIYYEDFDRDPDTFIRTMLTEIGLPVPDDFNANCDLVKVHTGLISERINGIERVTTGFSGLSFRTSRWMNNWVVRRINLWK